jgi:LPS sulfotransferase NodH
MSSVKFVVLTTSRTGSTWLIDLLNQIGVEAHGELFLRQPRTTPPLVGRADYKRFVDYYRGPRALRFGHVVRFLNELYNRSHAVGFKLMYGQLRSYPEVGAYLCVRRVRILHLIRDNLIDALVSEELARITGVSHVRKDGDLPVPTVHLRTSDLVRRLDRRRRATAIASKLVRLSMCPCLEVTYERLLDSPTELQGIAGFLNSSVGAVSPQSRLAKRGSREQRHSISNYKEVAAALAGSPYASMLRS